MRELPNTDIGVSAFDSPSNIKAAYNRIQQEIEYLEAAIRAWKTRHNTLSIISRLPVEILSSIFQCSASFYRNTTGRSGIWIVSQVCSHWRHVALEDPSLWSWISLNRPGAEAPVMLQRSRMAPLRITCNFGFNGPVYPGYSGQGPVLQFGTPERLILYPSAPLLHATLARLSRIQELSIFEKQVNPLISMGAFLWRLANPAPFLETLLIVYVPGPQNLHLGTPEIPHNIFLGQAPRLHTLFIQHVRLRWDSPFLHTLTSLAVLSYPGAGQSSIGHVLSALENMPNLIQLRLSHTLHFLPLDAIIPPPQQPLRLPRLMHLNVTADIVSCAYMVRYLASPAAVIVLECLHPFTGNTPNLALPILGDLGQSLGRGTRPIRSLSLFCTGNKSTIFRTWDSSGTCSNSPTCRPQFEINLGYSHLLPEDSTEILQSLSAALPLGDLETLFVDSRFIKRDHWIQKWGRLNSLRNLHIYGNDTGILPALCEGVPQLESQGSAHGEPLRFPALRTLMIQQMAAERREMKLYFEQLTTCLHFGRRQGRVVDRIDILDCVNVKESDILMLLPVVNWEVYWDNWQHRMGEDTDDSDGSDFSTDSEWQLTEVEDSEEDDDEEDDDDDEDEE
ncbi:hypothetical protein Hypma_005511 [Hypsizygus marmoreus]|uniref:F-box domain-containing protein n=1 Tax=Hypsizygus marmoreus TaxID=39966 RepID=A0A369J2Z8_HYPMA|nr:hypothetical protein Hypma_005511 [Hypsizygus marmoreus]